MPCPLCRNPFIISEDGFPGLLKDSYMERLIGTMKIFGSSSDHVLCDACPDESETPRAEMYCTDCGMKLCDKCCRHHRHSKITHKHTLITLDQTITGKLLETVFPNLCEQHDQEQMKFYCTDCEKVLCALCYIENHQNHKRLDVNAAAEEFRKQIKENVDGISDFCKLFSSKQQELETKEIEILKLIEDLESQVMFSKDELKKVVDIDSEKLQQCIASIKQQYLNEIKVGKDEIQFPLFVLESFKAYSTGISTKGSASDICQAIRSLSERGRELKQLYHSTSTSGFQSNFQPFYYLFDKTNLTEFLKRFHNDNIVGTIDNGEENVTSKRRYRAEYEDELLTEIDELQEKLNREGEGKKILEAQHKKSCDAIEAFKRTIAVKDLEFTKHKNYEEELIKRHEQAKNDWRKNKKNSTTEQHNWKKKRR